MSRPVSIPALLEGWVDDAPALEVTGLCLDAGRIEPGQAYLHVGKGCPRDAQSRGARILIHGDGERLGGLDIPSVELPGLAGRIASLGARFYRHPADQMKIAGVAGGGSPVAFYIAQSWRRVYGAAGLATEIEAGAAGALTLQRSLAECLDEGAEAAAVEVTARMLENGWLDEIAFEVALHVGNGPDRQTGLRPLFTACRPRFAVVNHDDAEGKALTRLAAEGVQILTFGTNGATELQGSVLGMDSSGMTLSLASPWGGGQVRTGLLGRENLEYLLAAAGALALMGMPWSRVMHQLEIMSALPGRMNCIDGEPGQPTAVIDAARTPAALESVLRSLRSHLHGRLHCVLAGSGAQRERMFRVAESFSDRIYPASAATRSDVIRRAIRECGRGDIVLIAGVWQGKGMRGGEAEVRDLLEEAA